MQFLLADGQILPTSRRQEVSANGTLVLHRVDSSTDRGAYTCTAKNKQGRSDSQTIHIEVKGKVVSLPHTILFLSFFSPTHGDFIRLNWNNGVSQKCVCMRPRRRSMTVIRFAGILRGPFRGVNL